MKTRKRHLSMMGVGKLSALALAALSIGATAPELPNISANQQQTTAQNKSATPVKETRVQQKVKGVVGGQDFIGLNIGIPPHIYGNT